MGLFENLPFTNFENLNLDMIVKDISTMKGNEEYLNDKVDEIEEQIGDFNIEELEGRVDALEASDTAQNTEINSIKGRVTTLEASDTAQNTEINSIKSRLTAAEGNIQNNASDIEENDEASRGRDDALSARIRNLEQATIHDIYNYYGSKNMIIFGSDLRNLPESCLDTDGFPFCWGNKYNQRFSVGTETARAWKFVANGLAPDTNQTSYDYYQCGSIPTDLPLSPTNPATLTIKTRAGNVYQHKFTSSADVWTIGTNCQVKLANDANLGGSTIWLMGTPQDWNTFLSGSFIEFMYFEYGEGSIDPAKTMPYDIKDRNFFGHDATPTIDVETIEGNASATATVTYYDQVGEPQTLEAGVNLVVSASKYGKVVDGYLQMRINLENNLGDKLASGAQFTLANVAMSYLSADTLPMPRGSSTLLGVASDSRSVEWDYVNTQNAYVWFNIDSGAGAIGNRGTFNVKLISSGLRNYTSGSATGNTTLKIPFHYIAS